MNLSLPQQWNYSDLVIHETTIEMKTLTSVLPMVF